jgi:short subunit dehydrogenase-like uncharacterized protein
MDAPFLIYGANGYTGELIARAARARGLAPILAARREAALRPLATELGLELRSFALDDPRAVDTGLSGVRAVLHCAGPFSQTSRALADGCLRTRTHYLDVTGEVAVFEALAARDTEAKSCGVMLLPGVGFDVVPTDCLAAHLKRRLPSASQLRLAFQAAMGLSRGTAKSTIEGFGRPNLVRQNGVLTPQPMGALTKQIDFGAGPVTAVSIPWGDVSTAYYSTGIPNIEVYTVVPAAVRLGMRASTWLGPLLRSNVVQNFLKQRVQAGGTGPNAEQRARAGAHVWGEALDDAGQHVVSRLETPDGYTLTVETALASVARVLAGDATPGFQTPSTAYGADFIMQVPDVHRTDL